MQTRSDLEKRLVVLQTRLYDLERKPITEVERPIRDVGIEAIRTSLTQVGRQLSAFPGRTF